ncbi:MAG: helix-turn-helix domain-containing protein, partial [Burkholderiaceae bacterium]
QEHRRIGELAERLGFASAASFNRLFKQAYGLAPRAYREREWQRHRRLADYAGVDDIGRFDGWIRGLASR